MRGRHLLTALASCAVIVALGASPALAQTAGNAKPKPQPQAQPQSRVRTYLNHLEEKLVTPPVRQRTPAAVTSVRG